MGVSVGKLYKNGTALYQMKLVAGGNGLNKQVHWVHIIEDEAVAGFLHGHELVFTAGIRNTTPDWLPSFARRLEAEGASALVVNIGPHTKMVPPEVIRFCNQAELPLFTIPWETRMVDMTRDFCHRIMHSDAANEKLASTVKDLLFNIGDSRAQLAQLERYGFLRDNPHCFLSVQQARGAEPFSVKRLEALEDLAHRIAASIQDLFLHFTHQEQLVLLLSNYTQEKIQRFVDAFFREARDVHLGVSANLPDLAAQGDSLNNAIALGRLAARRGEPVLYYDHLGFEQILLQVRDKDVLQAYYDSLVGKVEQHDQENGTALMDFMRTYLRLDGSPQAVAGQAFVHRNTVQNMLRKIERITGHNLARMDARMRCAVGMLIKDFM